MLRLQQPLSCGKTSKVLQSKSKLHSDDVQVGEQKRTGDCPPVCHGKG